MSRYVRSKRPFLCKSCSREFLRKLLIHRAGHPRRKAAAA